MGWHGSESLMSSTATRATELLCPKCKSTSVWRSHREGLWEWILHFILYTSPYRCDECGRRFYAGRGVRPPRRLHSKDRNG